MLTIQRQTRAEDLAHWFCCLPHKHKDLSSILSTKNKQTNTNRILAYSENQLKATAMLPLTLTTEKNSAMIA